MQDSDLLMEILEIQESIADAETADDLKQVRDANQRTLLFFPLLMPALTLAAPVRIDSTISELAESFKQGDIEKAKAATIQLRYWYNIAHAINEKHV